MDDSQGTAAGSNLYAVYRLNARNRDYNFEITKEFFHELTKENCYYCGREPDNLHVSSQIQGGKQYDYYYNYNGVDRADNSLGYEKENCVPCCSQCNRAKGTMSSEEYIAFIRRVYRHQEVKS